MQQPLLAQIPLPEGMNGKVRPLLEGIQKSVYNVKGNYCRTLGDAIIVLETRDQGGEVCSTNKKTTSPVPDVSGDAAITRLPGKWCLQFAINLSQLTTGYTFLDS